MIRRTLSNTAAFAAVPIINGVSTLLALPVITAQFGAAGWEAIGLGFAIGSAGSIIVELGWGVVGPLRVARASPSARSRAYWWSLQARVLVLIPVALLAAILAAVLVSGFRLEAMLMAVASAAVGLSPTWFFTGTSQPVRILLADSAPRLIAVTISAVVIGMGAALLVYPTLYLLAALISPWVGYMLSRAGQPRASLRPRRALQLIRLQFGVLGGRVAIALYTSTPVMIVALLAPGALAVYTAADRLMRSGLQVLNSINLQLTGWVGKQTTRSGREDQARHALKITVAVGAVAGLTAAFLLSPVSAWLFSGVATVTPLESAIMGCVIAVTVTSNGIGRLLLVRSQVATVNAAMWVRLLVASAAVAVGATLAGVAGAILGLLAGEVTALIFQSYKAVRSRPGKIT